VRSSLTMCTLRVNADARAHLLHLKSQLSKGEAPMLLAVAHNSLEKVV